MANPCAIFKELKCSEWQMKNIAVRNDKRLDKESKWNNVSFTPHNVVRKNSTYFKEEITTKTSCFLKEEDVFYFWRIS